MSSMRSRMNELDSMRLITFIVNFGYVRRRNNWTIAHGGFASSTVLPDDASLPKSKLTKRLMIYCIAKRSKTTTRLTICWNAKNRWTRKLAAQCLVFVDINFFVSCEEWEVSYSDEENLRKEAILARPVFSREIKYSRNISIVRPRPSSTFLE